MSTRSVDRDDRPRPRRLVLWFPTFVPPLWWVWDRIEARGSLGLMGLAVAAVIIGFVIVDALLTAAGSVLVGYGGVLGFFFNSYGLLLLIGFAGLVAVLALGVWMVPARQRSQLVCRGCCYPRPADPDDRMPRCPECGNAWRERPLAPWRRGFNRRCGTMWLGRWPRSAPLMALSGLLLVLSAACVAGGVGLAGWLTQPVESHVRNMPTDALRQIATGDVPPVRSSSANTGYFRAMAFGTLVRHESLSVDERLEVAMDVDRDLLEGVWADLPLVAAMIIDMLVVALAGDGLSSEAESWYFGPFTENLSIEPPGIDPSGAVTAARLVFRRDPSPGIWFLGGRDLFVFFKPDSVIVSGRDGERTLPATMPPRLGTHRLRDGLGSVNNVNVNVNALFPDAAPLVGITPAVGGPRERLVYEIDPSVFVRGERYTVTIAGTVFAEWRPVRAGRSIGAGRLGSYFGESSEARRVAPGRLWERGVRIERTFVVPGDIAGDDRGG